MTSRELGGGAVVVLLGSLSSATADEVAEAVRVRIRTAAHERAIVGRLVAADEQVLRVERPGPNEASDMVVVPRSSVTSLEVSRRPSRRGRGALMGGLIGAGAGAVILARREEGIASCPPPPGWSFVGQGRPLPPCHPEEGSGWTAAILAVPVGALFGALVSPGERWEAVDPAKLGIALGPAPGGGARVRLTVSF